MEAGELIDAGIKPEEVVELGELITADNDEASTGWSVDPVAVEDIRKSGDVMIFKSVGVGVQDVAIAQAVVEKARETGLGTGIEGYY